MESDNVHAHAQDAKAEFDEKSRRCTDVCCCIIFLVLLCGSFGIFFYALSISNWKYVYVPSDSRSLLCGYDNSKLNVQGSELLPDLSDKPDLFWVRPGIPGYALSFCVEECPSDGSILDSFEYYLKYADIEDGLDLTGTSYNADCSTNGTTKATVKGYTIGENTELSESEAYFCAYYSTAVFNRCFPKIDFDVSELDDTLSGIEENLSYIVNTSTLVTAVEDLFISWPVILVAGVASLVLSLIWLCLLRCCACFFVWSTVLLSVAGAVALTFACYLQSTDKFNNVATVTGYTFGVYSVELNKKVFTVLFYVCLALTIILLLLLVFLCPRIKLSVVIIKLVSKAFGDVPSLFFFPILIFVILLIWWIYVVVAFMTLYGAGEPVLEKNRGENEDKYAIDYKYDETIQYMAIYHFVMAIWVSLFLGSLNEMTIAGVIGLWYIAESPKSKSIPRLTTIKTFVKAIRYHLGSIAMGSFIITVCKLIRALLMYIDQKTKSSQTQLAKFVIKCCRCCMWCLEKFLKFLNRNAYALIINHGYSFWPACKEAFELIVSNCVRVATSNSVGDFTLFLGRVFVSAICTAGSLYYLLTYSDVSFVVVPTIIIFVISYLLAIPFTSLFEIGIDCMFLCFFEDEKKGAKNTPEELRSYIERNFKDENNDAGKGKVDGEPL